MSIKKNFFHNVLFILSNTLFPIITFTYASRILGPEGIGKVQFVVTFALYFVLIAALGIPAYGVWEVAKIREDKKKLSKLFSELLIINIICSVVLLIVYLIIVFSVRWFHNDIEFYILGGVIVLSGFSIEWFYIGMEQFHFLSIRSIIIKGVAVFGLFIFVRSPKDILAFFFISLFSIIGNNFWNLFNLRGQIAIKVKNLELKKHLPFLFILFSTSITLSIYTLVDTLFLGFLTDDRTVGFYTAAIKFSKIAIPLISSLGTVLIPRIVQSIVSKDDPLLQKLADQSFSFICLLAIPIAFGQLIYTSEIITVFSGRQFVEAIPTMQIAAPLVLLIGLSSIFGQQLLIPSGYAKGYLIATILGMGTSVLLYLTLIVLFKDKGAAVATITGELIVSVTTWYFVNKKMSLKFNWNLALNALLASVVFVPIAFLLRSFVLDVFIRLGFAVVSCGGVYFLTQIFIFKESQIRGVYLNMIMYLNKRH